MYILKWQFVYFQRFIDLTIHSHRNPYFEEAFVSVGSLWIDWHRRYTHVVIKVTVREIRPRSQASKGVFTLHQGDFRPGVSSLRFPLVALYLFTWYHHKMSCQREPPLGEFNLLMPCTASSSSSFSQKSKNLFSLLSMLASENNSSGSRREKRHEPWTQADHRHVLSYFLRGCLHEKTHTGASFIPGWLFEFVSHLYDDWVISYLVIWRYTSCW